LVVTAATATESKTLNLSLRILSDNLAPTNLRFPANLATSVSTAETLDWDDELNAQRYQIQIAPNSSFGRPLVDEIVDISSYVLNPASFISSSNYFWRVKALNDCGEGAYTTNSFTTFACNELNAAVPTPISIPDNDTNGIQSSFTVNEANNIAIGKLTVEVASTHEYSGDLLISLTSPSGTTVTLTNPNGCDTPNLNVLFDDDSQPFVCNTQAGLPGYTGVVAPVGNLSDFNGENINGVWTLNVSDRGPADLGTLNNWKITYCESPATASNADVETSEFVVYPNPSKGLFTVAAGSNNVNTSDAVINVLDLNGRVVFTKEVQNASRLNETIDVQNLSKGLYLLRVQQGASSTVKKIIIK
jgi:subtilisin-like proprotein convertase family protein